MPTYRSMQPPNVILSQIGGAIGGVIGAAAGAILGGVSGYITALYDNECGNRGVFIDVPWVFAATHATPVC